MPNYRRLFVNGGTWFFTVNLLDREATYLVDHMAALEAAVADTRRRVPFDLAAWVVLPDHIHAIWSLPPGDCDFPGRWRRIKKQFSKSLPAIEPRHASLIARGERGIWQRRYWEHLIRDEKDYDVHVRYCYFNPVKHGHVARVEDWPHSTFHRDLGSGFIPTDWSIIGDQDGDFGERPTT